MAKINLSELNQYIKNLYARIGLRQLEEIHAERVKQWLIENLSNIGRYAVRDFERTGTLNSLGKPYNDGRPVHVDRTDGWVSLTEEVPDIDHLTYGTGMLYVHGELEFPLYWQEQGGIPGDHMYEDEFHHVNYSGTQKFIFQRTTGDTYSFWYEPISRTPPAGASGWGDQGWEFGYLWDENPTLTPQITNGTFKGKDGFVPLYSDTVAWFYDTITYSISGIQVKEKIGTPADGDNDGDIYHLDNERNHYPWRIVNGATAKSVRYMLDEILVEKTNGMYDDTLPAIVTEVGTYPPIKGLRYVKDGKEGIVNFISPINEVPEGD